MQYIARLDSAVLQTVPITIGNINFTCPRMWAQIANLRYPYGYISARSGCLKKK
jgi:hypothetical protein